MNVVVPYVEHKSSKVTELVDDVLRSQTKEIIWIYCGHSPFDYHELLKSLWRQRETTIIVEHDILPWPGALAELWQCPCKWGSYSYPLHGGVGIHHGFGCTKLTGELMDAVPYVWEVAPIKWHDLDQRLWFVARAAGYEPHPHRPACIHLNRKHLVGADSD